MAADALDEAFFPMIDGDHATLTFLVGRGRTVSLVSGTEFDS